MGKASLDSLFVLTRQVVWPCLIKRLPFNLVVAQPGGKLEGGSASDAFRRLFPLGTVPSIDDPERGVLLSESGAILAYLSDVHGWSDIYPPLSDRAVRARVDEYINWHHSNARYLTVAYARPHFRPDKPSTPEARKAAEALAEQSLCTVESVFLARAPFVAGTLTPTAADFLLYSEAAPLGPQFGNVLDLARGGERPRIVAWMAAMSKLPYHDEVFTASRAMGELREDASGPDGEPLGPILSRLPAGNRAGLRAISSVIAVGEKR